MEVNLISITQDAEKVIESAGRTAYQSFNRQTMQSASKFIKMIIKNGHTSVLEHASASFRICNVSRALTHQLVRHRLCSYTQQSQRYVNESNFHFIIPNTIKDNENAKKIYLEFMNYAKMTYKNLRKNDIPKEDARFVLPNATASEIVITANFREWRHILELRGSIHAQWEIRNLAIKIYEILREETPSIFYDFSYNAEKNVLENKIEKIKN